MAWVALSSGNPWNLLLLLSTPFLILAYCSAAALFRRNRFGAWGSLAFFALQTISIERDNAPLWPGYNLGVMIEVFRDSGLVVDIGVSSIVFALLSIGVIRQLAEADGEDAPTYPAAQARSTLTL
jgi:hypothetical protein